MPDEKSTFPDKLLIRYINGEADVNECHEAETWIDKSEKNLRYFRELEDTWVLAVPKETKHGFDTDSAWESVLNSVNSEENKAGLQKTNTRKLYPFWWAAASVLLIAALFVWVQKTGEPNLIVYKATDTKRSVNLPDGSVMTLKAGSSAQFTEDFKQKRHLELSGTAFFEVKPNGDSPFEVRTGNALVKVLGTKFLLEESDGKVKCFVTEGRVSFAKLKDLNTSLILEKGDKGSMGNSPENRELEKSRKSLSDALFWLDQRLEFQEENLSNVIAQLERLYKIKVSFPDSGAAQCPVTASFMGESPEEILEILSVSTGLELSKTEGSETDFELRGVCK